MKKIFTLVSVLYNRLYWWTKISIYKRKGKNYIHDVKIDDFKYKMCFGNEPITANIVQRIEGRRELETLAVYKSIVRPGMKVLELGACFGEFTVLLDYLVGTSGKLVSVEGTPNIFKILQNNIKINKLKNTSIHKLFISNNEKEMYFGEEDNHPYNAINRSKNNNKIEPSSYYIKQKSMKISEFLKIQNFRPDVILMDIEGYEVHVIEDLFLGNKLSYKPKILFEIHDQFYPENKNLEYLKDILKKQNYRCIQIGSNLFSY